MKSSRTAQDCCIEPLIVNVVALLHISLALPMSHSALALTIEELRAILAVMLGTSNLLLLFVNRALAYEQQAADKAALNLAVLQKQVCRIPLSVSLLACQFAAGYCAVQ
jgi:hypothetical protein